MIYYKDIYLDFHNKGFYPSHTKRYMKESHGQQNKNRFI
jgi:hypothetical protein